MARSLSSYFIACGRSPLYRLVRRGVIGRNGIGCGVFQAMFGGRMALKAAQGDVEYLPLGMGRIDFQLLNSSGAVRGIKYRSDTPHH